MCISTSTCSIFFLKDKGLFWGGAKKSWIQSAQASRCESRGNCQIRVALKRGGVPFQKFTKKKRLNQALVNLGDIRLFEKEVPMSIRNNQILF